MNIKQVLNFMMTHKLHAFVPPFTLFSNIENSQNPARKHFEKTNNITCSCLLGHAIFIIMLLCIVNVETSLNLPPCYPGIVHAGTNEVREKLKYGGQMRIISW